MNDASSNNHAKPRLRFRWWAKLRANLGGYFFLPCPLCGEWFGGQEWSGACIYLHPDEPGHGTGICPACEREGKAQESPLLTGLRRAT